MSLRDPRPTLRGRRGAQTRRDTRSRGPADGDLVADLKGDFATQYVRHLVAVAVKMECCLGPSRRGFFERHDSVAGIAGQQLERR